MEWIKFWDGRRAVRASEVIDVSLAEYGPNTLAIAITLRSGDTHTLFGAEAVEAMLTLQVNLQTKKES